MDKGLFPKADKLLQMIKANQPEDQIELAAQDFVKAYAPYEMPNTVVTRFNQNNQVLAVALHFFPAWTRRKEDKKVVEATNLVVDRVTVEEVSQILEKEVLIGYQLATEDTKKLKENGFDLSRLSPGRAAFWSPPSAEDFSLWDQQRQGDYPQEGEKVIYKGPRYRSAYSTKLTAFVWRDGRKHPFKIKLGQEVHSEIIVGRLRKRLGFQQDHMKHFPEIKIWLGDKSYMQFERDLQVKYGTQQLRRHLLKRGEDENTGEPWVILRDVALEARPSSQVRVSPVDYGAYDGSRAREVRASVLIYAFLAQGDRSYKNFRSVLVPDDNGDYQVEYRMHDVGTALGRSPALVRRPRDILNFPLTKNKPEEYDRHYIWSDKKGNVFFIYNDFWHHYRDHAHSTYSDLKWSARLIASLTSEEIRDAVVMGGIPSELVESYVYHIMNMRNRAVKVFGLQHGEPTVLGRGPVQLNIPDIPKDVVRPDGYKVVKNGQIVGKHYSGSSILPVLQETWFTKINGLLSSRSIGRDIGGQYMNSDISFLPIARVQSDIGRSLWESHVPLSMTTFSVGVGLNATVARIVEPNRTYYCPSEGRSRAYVIRDTISFSVGINTAGVSSALARLGPEVSMNANLLRKSFQHIHFAESVNEGYRKSVHVNKLTKLGSIESLAVSVLTPGEVLTEYQAIGASAGAHLGFGVSVPYVGLASFGGSASFEAGQTNWSRVSYTKDQVGSLHLLLELDSQRTLGAQTEQFNVSAQSLINAAAFAIGAQRTSSNADVWNIEIVPPSYDLENATHALDDRTLKSEELVNTLKMVRRHPHLTLPENRNLNDLPGDVRLRYHYNGQKVESRDNFQLMYLLNHDSRREVTEFVVDTSDYSYRFFKKSRSKRGYQGIENTILNLGTKNVVIREGTSKRLTVEMDRDNPASLVVWVDVFDYHSSLTRKGLLKLLGKLNQRYSMPGSPENFFADPPQAKQEPYRRIYANGRLYINGDKLLKIVQDSSPESLWKLLKMTPTKHRLNFRMKRKVKKALSELTKAVEAFTQQNDVTKDEKLQSRLATASMNLVDSLYQSKWGVSYLYQLLGQDGMMVIAEVYGIHERTNMLQDPDWVSRLRYAGKSWGRLSNIPPVSRFIRVEQPTPANEHHQLSLPFKQFIGTVVTGYSGGYVGLGSR